MKGTRAIVRRLIAFVLLVGAVAMNVEALLPDVHDGDAQATVTASHVASLLSGSIERLADGTSQSSMPVHAAHLEHCSHSHLLIPATAKAPDVAVHQFTLVAAVSLEMPASVSPRLNQRPPIG